jgi:hypothetical protein
MKLVVQRGPSYQHATIGKLYIDGHYACCTLEDQIREVEGVPVDEWKVHGNTAIPAGTYRVTLEYSGRFGVDTLTINDVPGFKYIRIHAGNTHDDTEGCILVGMAATDHSLVGGTSRPALSLLKSQVQRAIAEGDTVTIEINNPTALA